MNNKKIQKFADLKTWQEGHRPVLMVYKETDNFPAKEKYSLTDQMRRAVVSITSNIAEGFIRRSAKEKNKFNFMAKSSLIELQNQLIISRDVGYLSKEKFKQIADQSIIVNKLLNAFIASTKNFKYKN